MGNIKLPPTWSNEEPPRHLKVLWYFYIFWWCWLTPIKIQTSNNRTHWEPNNRLNCSTLHKKHHAHVHCLALHVLILFYAPGVPTYEQAEASALWTAGIWKCGEYMKKKELARRRGLDKGEDHTERYRRHFNFTFSSKFCHDLIWEVLQHA